MYFLFYNSKKYSFILLKSTKFNRSKIQKYLELLSETLNDVQITTSKFNLSISQENLNEWPLISDIRNLDDIIIIPIPQEIIQKHKDELVNIELPTNNHGNKDKIGASQISW